MTKYINNKLLNYVMLSLYISFVVFSQIFIYVDSTIKIILFSSITIVFSFILSYLIFKYSTYIKINYVKKDVNNNRLIYFIISFIFLIVVGIALSVIRNNIFDLNTPFSTQPADLQVSINDALNNNYDEWHSVMFTLIFCKIPLMFFGDYLFGIYVFYILIRSFIISFVISDICNLLNNKLIFIILVLFYSMTPLSIHSETCCLKDTPCSLSALLSLYFLYKSYYNKNNIIYGIGLAIFSFFCIQFRHNSFLFAIPIIIVYILYNNFKLWIKVIGLFFTLVVLFNFVLFNILNVSKISKDKYKIETMGMPISVLCYMAKYNPSILNEKEYEYVCKLAGNDMKNYELYNEKQGYDSVKYDIPVFRENMFSSAENFTQGDFLKSFFSLMIRDPVGTFKQVFMLTCGVYAIRYREGSDTAKGISFLYFLFANIEIPILLFIFICIVLAKCKLNIFFDFNFASSLPIIIYVFVTMCLLSSNGVHRYFLPFQMCVPLYIINLLKENNFKKR